MVTHFCPSYFLPQGKGVLGKVGGSMKGKSTVRKRKEFDITSVSLPAPNFLVSKMFYEDTYMH